MTKDQRLSEIDHYKRRLSESLNDSLCPVLLDLGVFLKREGLLSDFAANYFMNCWIVNPILRVSKGEDVCWDWEKRRQMVRDLEKISL